MGSCQSYCGNSLIGSGGRQCRLYVDGNAIDCTRLYRAVLRHDLSSVKLYLRDHRTDLRTRHEAFLRSLWYGDPIGLLVVDEFLRDSKIDPSQNDTFDALTTACMQNQISVVERLLCDPRINPAAGYNAAFRMARYNVINYTQSHLYYRQATATFILGMIAQDVRVVFGYNTEILHMHIHKKNWYERQATRTRELHTELVATVGQLDTRE